MAHRPRAALGIAVAVTVLGALGATGCGSSSTTNSTAAGDATAPASTSKSATKAQFVAQAEAICSKLSTEEKPLKAQQEALKGLAPAAAEKPFVSLANQVVTLSRAADGQLRALTLPSAEASQIEELLTVYREETTDVANIAYAVGHQESSTGEAAAQALRRSITTNSATAQGYGMKDCIESE